MATFRGVSGAQLSPAATGRLSRGAKPVSNWFAISQARLKNSLASVWDLREMARGLGFVGVLGGALWCNWAVLNWLF
jgi:hypothetical protein